jgi:Skp family chaperone for outer membrane proteins
MFSRRLMTGAALCAMMAVPTFAEEAVGGLAIPGICVLNREAVFEQSKVGKDVTAQFKAARDAAQKDVKDQEAKIAADVKALEGQKASLTEDQYKLRRQELVQRLQDLRTNATKMSQDLEATRQDVVKRISKEAQPSIAAAYQTYRCSLLLSRDAVLAGNPGMDVTAEVIKGLDGKIASMPFERNKDDKSSM